MITCSASQHISAKRTKNKNKDKKKNKKKKALQIIKKKQYKFFIFQLIAVEFD